MLRLSLFLVLFSGGVSAQVTDTVEIFNRLQLGVVYGQMDHEVDFLPEQDVEPLRGNELGIALRYFDKQLVGFQAELSYVEAGWRENISDSLTDLYQRSTSYVELQILTQFSVGNGAVQPMLQAGPYLSFPLTDEETLPDGFVVEAEDGVPPVYGLDFPFRPNYGLRVGVGLNIELGSLTVQLDGRYLAGFNDLVRTGASQAAVSRRQGIGVHAGFFFAL